MSNSKLQQVFYYIVLDSLTKNPKNKGLYKQALSSIFKNFWQTYKALPTLIKHHPVNTALLTVGASVPIGLAVGAGHELIRHRLNRGRGETDLPDLPKDHLEKSLMNFREVLNDLNKKIEDYREGLKNMRGDTAKFPEKVKQDVVPFHKYFNANFKDKIKNSLTKDQLEKGVQNFMTNVRKDIEGMLSPQALSQNPEMRSDFRSGIVSLFADPMFRAIGADPDKVSPSLKLLTLLGLAGGTLGLGSYLGSKLTHMF